MSGRQFVVILTEVNGGAAGGAWREWAGSVDVVLSGTRWDRAGPCWAGRGEDGRASGVIATLTIRPLCAIISPW